MAKFRAEKWMNKIYTPKEWNSKAKKRRRKITHMHYYGQWQWKCQNIWIDFFVVALCRNAEHSTQIQCNLFSFIVALDWKGYKFFFFKKKIELSTRQSGQLENWLESKRAVKWAQCKRVLESWQNKFYRWMPEQLWTAKGKVNTKKK